MQQFFCQTYMTEIEIQLMVNMKGRREQKKYPEEVTSDMDFESASILVFIQF